MKLSTDCSSPIIDRFPFAFVFQVVLSACSTYFDTILSQYEEKDPIVIMRDVKFSDIKVLVEFMYKGEINIDHVSDPQVFTIDRRGLFHL